MDADARKVWLPRGVTIPCWVDGMLWYVKMRRPAGRSKYWSIRGGRSALFGGDLLGGRPVVLLCEGEFDAIANLESVFSEELDGRKAHLRKVDRLWRPWARGEKTQS